MGSITGHPLFCTIRRSVGIYDVFKVMVYFFRESTKCTFCAPRTFLYSYNVFNFANGGKRRKGDKNVTPDLTEEKEGEEETGKVGFPFRHPPKNTCKEWWTDTPKKGETEMQWGIFFLDQCKQRQPCMAKSGSRSTGQQARHYLDQGERGKGTSFNYVSFCRHDSLGLMIRISGDGGSDANSHTRTRSTYGNEREDSRKSLGRREDGLVLPSLEVVFGPFAKWPSSFLGGGKISSSFQVNSRFFLDAITSLSLCFQQEKER